MSWEKSSYSFSDRQIILTKWVDQTWRELHAEQSGLIRRPFRKLGISLAVHGSEDKDGRVELEERNNASRSRCEL